MVTACNPQKWMDYVTMIPNDLENKSRYIAIMDDLLIHSSKLAHFELLEDVLKAIMPTIQDFFNLHGE